MRNFNDKCGVVGSSEKKKIKSCLEQINELEDEEFVILRNKSSNFLGKLDSTKRNKYDEGPPKTLRDIFKISNKNRKRNK